MYFLTLLLPNCLSCFYGSPTWPTHRLYLSAPNNIQSNDYALPVVFRGVAKIHKWGHPAGQQMTIVRRSEHGFE